MTHSAPSPRRTRRITVAVALLVAATTAALVPAAGPASAASCSRTHKCATTLSFAAPGTHQARSAGIALSGALRRTSGAAISGRTVSVQYRVPGSSTWKRLGSDVTDSRGRWALKAPADRTYTLRATFRPSSSTALKASTSTARTSKITYPQLVLPTLTASVARCEVVHNDAESSEVRAEIQVTWAGGVYQINRPMATAQYFYSGRNFTSYWIYTNTDDIYDPDQTFTVTGEPVIVYRPGRADTSDTWVSGGELTVTFKQSSCSEVTAFTF